MLILLFNSQTEERIDLPKLHIQDSLKKIPVAVAGVKGEDSDFVQTIAIQFVPLQFQHLQENCSSGTVTKSIYVRRMTKVILCPVFPSSSDNATFRLIRIDASGNMSISSEKTSSAIFKQDEKWIGEEVIFETYGADKVKIYIQQATNNVDIRVAGV